MRTQDSDNKKMRHSMSDAKKERSSDVRIDAVVDNPAKSILFDLTRDSLFMDKVQGGLFGAFIGESLAG